MKPYKEILGLLAFGLLFSCDNAASVVAPEEVLPASVAQSSMIEVETVPARLAAFPIQVQTNGRIEARKKVALQIPVAGQIAHFHIETGKVVKKGALLLALDDTDQQLELAQYQFSVDDAEVAKADMLISNGGEAYVDTSVSAQRLEFINKLSGYNKALHGLEIAKRALEKTQVYAPFSGYLADVKVRSQDYLAPGQEICTLIDPGSFEVSFSLVEQSALDMKLGTSISFSPLATPNKVYRAKISAVNPMVDAQGLVKFYAKIVGANHRLWEGMQVHLSINRQVDQQVIVPREALVLRSGRPVVFTYDKKSGLAKWNYIEIAYENSQEIAIKEGIAPGQEVIINGNLNLDHDAKVQIQEH